MKAWRAASKSRTVLLVVIGVLLLPTIALGAKLVSPSWQTGSVTVKKFGPLPTVDWVVTDADWVGWRYERSVAMATPSLGDSGAIWSRLAVKWSIVFPESVKNGLVAATGQSELTICSVASGLYAGDAPLSTNANPVITFFSRTITYEDAVALSAAGGSSVIDLTPSEARAFLSGASIGMAIVCGNQGEPVKPNLGADPIRIAVESIRVQEF